MNKEEKLEYLEAERQKIWEKLTELQLLINSKISDSESEAKKSAEQSAEFKTASEEAKNIIVKNLGEANTILEELKTLYTSLEESNKRMKVYDEDSKYNSSLIDKLHSEIAEKFELVKTQVVEIEKTFEAKVQLDEKLRNLEEIFTRGDDYDSKLGSLNKAIIERKKEIDELYYEIIGYTEKNEEGTDVEVEGLKDKLEKSYDYVKIKLEEIDKELTTLKANTTSNYETFIQEKNTNYNIQLESWKETYEIIEKKIYDLLPRALTAGLSYAYSEKKVNEEKENLKLSSTFKWAIAGLILISIIPFTLSIKSIYDGKDLEVILSRIPRLVLAILPLYIPVLWVAYSANRKMNLSKRLVEEYTHKEVLSKTFEGLSKQISDINDKDISNDLKIKLLYNILEVNSENPGKLISDYNKSDHPLMDALDKSVKLTNAVTKLAKIPGFAKLASNLEKKSQEMLKEEARKADAGIESLTTEEKKK